MLVVSHHPHMESVEEYGQPTSFGPHPETKGKVGFTRTSSCRESTSWTLFNMLQENPKAGNTRLDIHGIISCLAADARITNNKVPESEEIDRWFLPLIYSVEALTRQSVRPGFVVNGVSLANLLVGNIRERYDRATGMHERLVNPFDYSVGSDLADVVSCKSVSRHAGSRPTGSITGMTLGYAEYKPFISAMTYLVRIWGCLRRTETPVGHRSFGFRTSSRIQLRVLAEKLVGSTTGLAFNSTTDNLWQNLANNYMARTWHTYFGGPKFWSFLYMVCHAALNPEVRDNFAHNLSEISCNGLTTWTNTVMAEGNRENCWVTQKAYIVYTILNTCGYSPFIRPWGMEV